MIYLKDDHVNVYWDEESEAVMAESLSYLEGEEFRKAMDAGIELLKQKGSKRWIADARNIGPLTQEDQRWTNESWFPRVIAAGMRYMAMLEPRRVVARMSSKRILSQVDGKDITIAYFDSLVEARAWLRAQK